MNIDIESLKKIDFQDVSRWPMALQAIAILFLSLAVVGAGMWFDTRSQYDLLTAAANKERQLKDEFLSKQHKAANLPAYRKQMEEMKTSFGTMLRQLPGKTEVAELLLDISQAGLQAGLEFELFKPEAELPAEFYAELPIKIKVTGRYHQFGEFISRVADLSRIVTLHDFSIEPSTIVSEKNKAATNNLIMSVTAKTYRYLGEDEIEGE